MTRAFILLSLFLLAGAPPWAWAQGRRFEPPRPPPLDSGDFDDADDPMDMGDDDFRAPPPPPPPPLPGGASQLPAGGANPFPNDPYNANLGPNSPVVMTTPGKFRFQLVDGEFWEKGKKRTRGRETRVSGEASGR